MGILIIFAFISGLITILAPCIWPLLPIILSSTATGGKQKPLGITLGVMISFMVFTLAIAYIVKVIPFNTNIIRIFAAFIIGFLGLTLLIPKLNIIVEGSVSKLSSRFASKKVDTTNGFFSGLITGLSLGIVWSPCAGPILATIAALASTQAVNSQVVFVTLAYTIGTGIPLFIFATLGSKLFQKSKAVNKYLGTIQRVFGVIVIITALAIGTNYDRFIEAKLLTIVPSYSNILNGIEGNKSVSNELNGLKGGKTDLPVMAKAPDFTGINKWLNPEQQIHIADLKGKVVLVDFWTYTCINCIRTLPYVTKWYDTYKNDGFVVIGVHTPEFQFEKDTNNVKQAINQYNIHYPVAQDNDYATWNAYNNQYWPAEYLIDANGNIRKEDFGEGKYNEMEQAIRGLIAENGKQVTQKATDIKDQTPTRQITPETYLGYNRVNSLVADETAGQGVQNFSSTITPDISGIKYSGKIDIQGDYIIPQQGSSLDLNFYASKVYLVIKPTNSSSTSISALLDGKQLTKDQAGVDIQSGYIQLNNQRLYSLIDLKGSYEQHTLHLDFHTNDIQVYVFTFG